MYDPYFNDLSLEQLKDDGNPMSLSRIPIASSLPFDSADFENYINGPGLDAEFDNENFLGLKDVDDENLIRLIITLASPLQMTWTLPAVYDASGNSSSSSFTLRINGTTIESGQSVLLSYANTNTDYTDSGITDLAGNDLASFAFQLDNMSGQVSNTPPVVAYGGIQNLVILEDSPIQNLGLSSVSYSPGKDNEQAQTLSYEVTAIPDVELGTIKFADGDNGDIAVQVVTEEQLQGLQFEAALNAVGSSTFTFLVKDTGSEEEADSLSLEQTLNIDILGVNDAPIFNTDPDEDGNQPAQNLNPAESSPIVGDPLTTIDEDSPFSFTSAQLLDGFSDADGDTLSIAGATASDGELSYDQTSDTYNYTPEADFNGTVVIDFAVTDGNGATTIAAKTINITSINDAPALVDANALFLPNIKKTAASPSPRKNCSTLSMTLMRIPSAFLKTHSPCSTPPKAS